MPSLRFLAVPAILCLLSGPVQGASTVPSRTIPPSVLVELQQLEHRFELALAADCDAARCFAKGCTYVDHAVADQPRSGSLPGLGQEAGPGATTSQAYLTQARCSFAHEAALATSDVQALNRRLQAKLSSGWTVVSVDNQLLAELPPYLRQPPQVEAEPEVEPEVTEPPAQALTQETAGHELWSTLLPHFFWMIGVVLVSLAGILLIWAWRRVGRISVEEQALLAELARPQDEQSAAAAESAVDRAQAQAAFVDERAAAWAARLDAVEVDRPDPELHALVRGLLRSGDQALLAKAVLTFPHFLAAFPSGGELATAKLELADYLKTVDADALPSDVDFFESLDRHALSAALASQGDAEVVRSLREDFGAAGLVALIAQLPTRVGALLFALSPPVEQVEMVRLLSPRQIWELAEQLLRSNRMDEAEAQTLFEVIDQARRGAAVPPTAHVGPVTDHGSAIDAAGALSVLLPALGAARRAALFGAAIERFGGSLPAWYRGIFVADMLFVISDEARVDLLLEIPVEALAAWLSVLDADARGRLLSAMPDSLRASVGAASVFPSRAQQLALAARGRQALARGFQIQLARARLPFESVVQPAAQAGP